MDATNPDMDIDMPMDTGTLPGMPGQPVTAGAVAACWGALREHGPLVQSITNMVVAPFTANVLLAAGAAPAMIDNVHESADFARMAGGLLTNLGTPREETVAAMKVAVVGAAEGRTPWVLDPIGAGSLPWRSAVARELLTLASPAIIRGNASEIIGLDGGEGGRGADTAHGTEDAIPSALALAGRHGCVVATSGALDHLTDGSRVVRVPHGHPWMTRVTGVGCALGALMAACAAVEEDHLVAATTATAAMTLAAEAAARATRGPGTFAAQLLDELSLLSPQGLESEVDLQ